MKEIAFCLGFSLILLVLSCAKTDHELAGDYVTYKPSFFEKVYRFAKNQSWTIGTTLTLNKDSSFKMATCGNYIKGKWYAQSDTVFLCFYEKSYRRDSLNYIDKWKERLKPSGKPIPYAINDEYLERVDLNTKKKKIITKLVKIKKVDNQ